MSKFLLPFTFTHHTGGLNEANVRDMTASGTFDEYTKALTTTLQRLTGDVELTQVEE